MKILIVHDRYQERGGEDIAVELLIQLLQENGFEISIYERNNDELNLFSWKQKFLFFFDTVYSARTVKEINKVIEDFKPDIAHIHNVFPLISPSVYRVLRQNKIPIVQTIHNYRFMCPNGLFYTQGHLCERCKNGCTIHAIIHKCYRNSVLLSSLYAFSIAFHRSLNTFSAIDSFIVLNNFTKRKLVESEITHNEKIQVIPNFLSYDLKKNDFNEDRQNLVYIGRLSREKGVKDVIDCAKRIPELCVKIIGTGPVEHELRESAVELQSRIQFTGYLSGEEKRKELESALAIVIPSRCYEQFPITALEAMALGKPLIVPDISGLNEIVDDMRTGLIYEQGNIDDMAQKVNLLLQNHALAKKLGIQARKKFEEQYSKQMYLEKVSSLYESLITQ
jgi:glycosyltransferase involved in cell wall biosynthesis